MKSIKTQIIASILIILASTNLSSQCNFIDPPEPDPLLTGCASANGLYLPASGTIRLLIVFAEIDYDVIPGNDPNPGTNPDWPLHSIPSWTDDLLDPNVPTGTAEGLLTRYYQQASSGNYYVLGDYLLAPYNDGIFLVLESDINSSSYKTALCTEINSAMNGNFVTGNNLNNVSYFDNWTTTGSYQLKITPSIDNPPKIDHVIVIWRNRIDKDKVGGAAPWSYGSIVGYETDTYSEFGSYNTIPLKITRHEYSHLIIGGNFFHPYKDRKGYWAQYVEAWGALSLSDASFLCWSGWDRQRLGWLAQGNQYNPAARNANNTAEVNGDLDASEPAHAGTYYLRDFVVTGDALRIKLPYLNPDDDYEQWLWIENHNGHDENNNVFDKFQYQDVSCVQPCIPGLYMYLQIDKDVREGTSAQVGSLIRDYLRPVTAEGFYDRLYDTEVQNQCVNAEYYEPFIIIPELENTLTGGGDQGLYALDKNNDNEINVSEGENNINFIQKDGSN